MNKQYYILGFALLFFANLGISQKDISLNYNQEDVLQSKFYKVLTLEKPLVSKDHLYLRSIGVELLEHMGKNQFLASFPINTAKNSLLNIPVASIMPLEAYHKSNAELRSSSLPEWAIEGKDALMILRYPSNLDQELVKKWCVDNKMIITASNGYNNQIEVKLPINNLTKAINLPFVIGLEAIAPPSKPDDKLGRNLHRVNRINSTTGAIRNYTGAGVTVLVRDDGQVFEHIDFTGRMDNTFCGESRGDHGDGVAGLIAGAGNLDPDNQGMAFGSDMFVIDYRSNFLDQTMSLVIDYGVLITNSSYSDGCNGGYTGNTRNVDQQMFENPKLLHVFSAGNDGESDCDYGAGPNWGNITGGHKIGKNVIAVANLNNLNVVESSSSRGPAFDGRIKPDIAANGFDHVSTVESQSYAPFGGTSAAAPVVAGISSMLYEAYIVNHGEIPNAGLIKAIMLNTATDLGNKGPDFIFGWGSVNAHKAALAIEEGRFIQGSIDQEESKSHTIEIPANVKEVKIMTYWPDQNGTTSNSLHLINDINSIVVKDSETFLPWVLDHSPDPAKLDAPATKGQDSRNNMEQIAIENPSPGTYELQLSANYIPFGATTYYVVWEFGTDAIDITYPNGGENILSGDREVIHWDAEGDEGEFEINLLTASGDTLMTRTTPGDRRFTSISMPSSFYDSLIVSISRNGISDQSDEAFILSDQPTGLKTERQEDGTTLLSWVGFDEAVSYNIYVLGEKYMEIDDTSFTTNFLFPNKEKYKIGWVAVSANFADGQEGKRTVAIPIRPAPLAQVSDNSGSRPCIDEIVIFSTEAQDTLTTYIWNFGPYSTPEEAFTAGPHEVTYSRRGKKTGYLKVSHEGGTDAEFFEVNVQRLPEGNTLNAASLGFGAFNFTNDLQYVDSIIWDMGDGTTLVGSTINYTYLADGVYTVTMIGKSSCDDVVITLEVFASLTTNTDDIDLSISIKPNPSDGNFTIVVPELTAGSSRVELINMDGRKIYSKQVTSTEIKLSDIPSGMYVLHFTVDDKRITRKIIVN